MNLLSAFGGGLFIIPVGLFLAALFSFYKGLKQSKSGSTRQVGTNVIDSGNIPFWKCPATVFGYILLAGAIGSAVWMWLEK